MSWVLNCLLCFMVCCDELIFDTRRISIIIDVMKEDTHGLCRQFFSRRGCPVRPRPSYISYHIISYIILSYVLYKYIRQDPDLFTFQGFLRVNGVVQRRLGVERYQMHSVFQSFVRANVIMVFNPFFVTNLFMCFNPTMLDSPISADFVQVRWGQWQELHLGS